MSATGGTKSKSVNAPPVDPAEAWTRIVLPPMTRRSPSPGRSANPRSAIAASIFRRGGGRVSYRCGSLRSVAFGGKRLPVRIAGRLHEQRIDGAARRGRRRAAHPVALGHERVDVEDRREATFEIVSRPVHAPCRDERGRVRVAVPPRQPNPPQSPARVLVSGYPSEGWRQSLDPGAWEVVRSPLRPRSLSSPLASRAR